MATRTIGTEIVLSGEKQFNDAMKGVNNNLKNLRTDMALVSTEFDGNADSMEALTSKQKVLESSVDQHRAKVDALRKMYERMVELHGENSAKADEYKQKLNQATVALTKETAALEENSKKLKDSRNVVKNAVSGYVGLIDKLAEAKDGIDQFSEKQKKAKELLKSTVAPVTTFTNGLGKVATASMKVGTAVAAGLATMSTAAIVSMANMAKEAAEAAKAASEAGEELTESQQAWLAYSKQLDALDASVASAKSALGGVLLPLLGDLSTEGAAFLNDFSRDMEAAAGDTGKQTQVLSDYIVKGAKLIKEKLPEYIDAGKELFSGLADGLGESGPELLDMGLDLVMDLLDGIISYAPELAEAGIALIQKLTEGLIERGPDLMTSAVGMVTQIVTGLAKAAPDLIPAAGQLITQLITALIESAPQLLLAGLELVYGIISGITDGLGDIVGSADTIINTIKEAFVENADEFLSIGSNIIQGIWRGIESATEWLYNLISRWVDDVVGWICEKLDIHSPSGVTERRVGYNMARGVGVGWENEMKNVNKQIADSINTSFDIPDFQVGHRVYSGRSYSTATGKTVNFYITAQTLSKADIDMLLALADRKLGDDL